MKQFTFYDLYYKLIKNVEDKSAGRIGKAICAYNFDSATPVPFADDTEAFLWSNIEDVLEQTKNLEAAGKTPKSYFKKMKHFAFSDSYYRAMKLMDDGQSGMYLKALCGYMFESAESKKLKPPVDGYFELAKTKLLLSKVRIASGKKGGNAERVKLTDEEINALTTSEADVTFEEFMHLHSNIENDLYDSHRRLLEGVDWAWLDYAISKCPKYRNCNSLRQLLLHRKEIESGL